MTIFKNVVYSIFELKGFIYIADISADFVVLSES